MSSVYFAFQMFLKIVIRGTCVIQMRHCFVEDSVDYFLKNVIVQERVMDGTSVKMGQIPVTIMTHRTDMMHS